MDETTLFLPNAAPNWQEAFNDLNQSGQAFVVASVRNPFRGLNAKLLVFRDSVQQLRGVFMIYLPDAAYHTQTNGNYSPSTFTGIVVYTDVSGHAFLSCRIANGQIQNLYDATITDGRGATLRNCLDILFPSCPIPFGANFSLCGSMRFCDCSGNCGTSANWGFNGVVVGPVGGRGFSYGNPPSTSSGSGNTGSGGGGGGGAWNSSQPTSLFTMSEIESLRIKFRLAGLDDIFYTLELNQSLLRAANLFLDTRGWDNLNKPALENLVNTTGEYAALAEYLTALSVYTDFYNANVNTNTLVSTFVAFAKYNKAGFTAEKFVKLYSNAPLFTQLNAYLARNSNNIDAWENVKEIESEYERENNPLDVTFAQDAELHLKLLEQSSEFVELSNSLNTLGGIGSGNSPMKNVLLDLLLEGAQEWAENFLGIPDLQELRGLLEQGVESTGKKVAFKATRIIARFIAKKNPLFNALSSMWKAKQIYSKISRVYKRLNGLWQNRYFVGIEQKLEKVYESLKRNKLLAKLDVDDNGGLVTNSNKDQFVWNDLVSNFGVTPISDGRGNGGLKFQVDNFIFNWYPVSNSYSSPTIEMIYKHPSTGNESTIVKIRF